MPFPEVDTSMISTETFNTADEARKDALKKNSFRRRLVSICQEEFVNSTANVSIVYSILYSILCCYILYTSYYLHNTCVYRTIGYMLYYICLIQLTDTYLYTLFYLQCTYCKLYCILFHTIYLYILYFIYS